MRCPNKNTKDWKDLVSLNGESGAYQKYVENNFELPFVERTYFDYGIMGRTLNEAQHNQLETHKKLINTLGTKLDDYDFEKSGVGKEKIGLIVKPIAEKLRSMTGVNVKILTQADIDQIAANADRSGDTIAGLWDRHTKTAVLVEEKLDTATTIHEVFMHPFLDYIKTERPALYNNLVNKSNADPYLALHTIDVYGKDDPYIEDEIIQAAFRKYIIQEDSKNGTQTSGIKSLIRALQELARQFNMFLRDVFGLNNISMLSDNLTFGQLYDIIKYSDVKYDINDKLNYINGYHFQISESRIIDRENGVTDITEIQNIVKDKTKHMMFVRDGHKYVNTLTGDEYTSVTDIKSRAGYGDIIDKDSDQSHYTFSGQVGTTIHDFTDAVFFGDEYVAKEDHLPISDKAKKEMIGINNMLKKHADIILSEQLLVDDETKIAGTIDRLFKRKSDDKILIIDLKTKIVNQYDADGNSTYKSKNGADYTQFSNYYQTKYRDEGSRPDKEKHDFQQTMYKRLFELYGVKIDYKGILPIETIIRTDKNGQKYIDEVRIASQKVIKTDPNMRYINLTTDYNVEKRVDAELGIIKSEDEKLDPTKLARLQEITRDGLSVLKLQASYLKVMGSKYRSELIMQDLPESEDIGPVHIAYDLINATSSIISSYMNRYNKLEELSKTEGDNVWDIRAAKEWQEFTNAITGTIQNLKIFHNENPEYFSSIEGLDVQLFESVLTSLTDEIAKLNNAYSVKVLPRWINLMSERSKTVEFTYRRNFRDKWMADHKALQETKPESEREKFDEAAKERMFKEEQAYIQENAAIIKTDTVSFVTTQAKIADNDVHFLNRWLTTIYDTQDPIAGIQMKIQYDNLMEMKHQFKNNQIRLANIVDRLDKQLGTTSITNPREVYDYMIDVTDNGTFELVSKIPNSFVAAQKEAFRQIETLYESTTSNEVYQAKQKWLNEHAPLTDDVKDDIKSDKLILYNDLLSENIITDDEYQVLASNEAKLKPDTLYYLYKTKQLLSKQTYGILRAEVTDIEKNRRIPNRALYPNQKYYDIQAMDDSDARKELYNFLIRMQDEVNGYLPRYMAKGRQLPGIRKNFQDRVVDGQNFIKTTTAWLGDKVIVRDDEDQRNITVMTDASGKQLLSVPMHYTNALTEADQNFDLPSIFNQWYHAGLSYAYTTNIISTLEYTSHVLNSRKVRKTAGGKKLLNKLALAFNKDNLSQEGVDAFVDAGESNLAKQYDSWMTQAVYGAKEADYGKITSLNLDVNKMLGQVRGFTSFKIMGLNFLSMVNNYLMAETSQIVEAAAGTLTSISTYNKASVEYMANIGDILGDIGSRRFKSKINGLMDYFMLFDARNQYDKFRDKSISKRLFKNSFFYATTELGEHAVQSRFLISVLMDTEVFDKDGNSLGNLYDNMNMSDEGIITINDAVDNDGHIFNDVNEIINSIGRKVSRTIREMHGNYTDYTPIMISANNFASLIMQFRHWLPSGFNRRWQKHHFSEFTEMEHAGYFRYGLGTAKMATQLGYYKFMNVLGKAVDEVKVKDLQTKLDWQYMDPIRKSATKRLTMDASILLSAFALLQALARVDYDRDDEPIFSFFLDNMMYQLYRLNLEQLSYIKLDEATQILNSPFAGLSWWTGWADVISQGTGYNFDEQQLSMFDTYKAGRFKDENKLWRKTLKNIPVLRQFDRVLNANESLSAIQLN